MRVKLHRPILLNIMTTKYPLLIKFAFLALAVTFPLVTAVKADSISGYMASAPTNVNLNLSSAYAYYGASTTPATDPSNIAYFSVMERHGGGDGFGNDLQFNLTTYNNGTTSGANSPNYSRETLANGASLPMTQSFTNTLFATNEYVSVYVFSYDDKPDFLATIGSASFALTNILLPSTIDSINNTGQGHRYGMLNLAVTGTVGETLIIKEAANTNGVSDTSFSTIGISAATLTTNAPGSSAPAPNQPTISPAGGTVAGVNVTLTEILLPQVSNPPYTYQWQLNNVNVGSSVTSSSSTNTFSINTTGFAVGSYNYRVVVTNSVGSATSAPVVLNILALTPIPGTSIYPTVWWEANAANNVINSGAVAQLTDQSGHGNNAVQDSQGGAPLPLLAANAVNGLPALSFDGTRALISPTGAMPGNSSHSIIMVASYQSIAQYRNGAVFYSDAAGSDQNSCLGVDPNTSHLWVGGYNQDNAPYIGTITFNGAGFNILSKIYDASSANYQGYVAGVQDVNATGDTYNLGNTRVGVGRQYNNGSYWAGDIAEVIVFNSVLSNSDLEAVQRYLANKYNVPLTVPPVLTAQLAAGNQIKLSWLNGPSYFELQSSTNVAGPYTPAGSLVTNQGLTSITFDTISGATTKFYQLHQVKYASIPVLSWQSDPDGATLQMSPGT